MLTMGKHTNKATFVIFMILSFIQDVSSVIPWDPGCGTIKGCFPNCPNGCDFLVTWRDSSTNIEFTIQVEEDDDTYAALGFSHDRRMGDDSVVGCIFPVSTAYSYYNDDTKSDKLSTPALGLTGISLNRADGILACNVTRSYNEDNADYFDLKDDYILMLITGPAGDNDMKAHKSIPWMSDEKVDFNKHYIVDLFDTGTSLVKCHGSMMMLAWLLVTIVGFVTVRYNKKAFPGVKVLGEGLWFPVHMALMITAVVLTIIAFIIIFVEIEGISQIPQGQKTLFAHPVIGIIVFILCFVNPIFGFLRCLFENKLKMVFYCIHLVVGILAMLLACANIFIGYNLERAKLPQSINWVTIVPVLLTVGVVIGLEVKKFISGDVAVGPEGEKNFSSGWKFPFLVSVILAVVLFIFALAILIMIALS